MTDTNKPAVEDQAAEIERMRAHSTELLAELKQARARIKELEQSAANDSEIVAAAKTELLNIKLNNPVEAILGSVLVGAKYSKQEIAEHYKFELNDAGEIEMRDLEGKPVMITERIGGKDTSRKLRFEEQDVWRFLTSTGKFDHIVRSSGASGSGALHSSTNYGPTKEPEKAPAAGTGFGLR